MPRFKIVECWAGMRQRDGDHLKFKYTVNVNAEGQFYTNLADEIALKFVSAGVLGHGIRYFEAATFGELKGQIQELADEMVSSKLIDEKIVLRYRIDTACSYAIDPDGVIVPHTGNEYLPPHKDLYGNAEHWRGGTISTDATNQHPYGIQIVVGPKLRKDYQFKSGKTVTKYSNIDDPAGEWLAWLDGLVGMGYDRWRSSSPGELEEIDYTEPVALFFVNLIKSICMMNEQIKDKLKPETIKALAESGVKLLGS